MNLRTLKKRKNIEAVEPAGTKGKHLSVSVQRVASSAELQLQLPPKLSQTRRASSFGLDLPPMQGLSPLGNGLYWPPPSRELMLGSRSQAEARSQLETSAL